MSDRGRRLILTKKDKVIAESKAAKEQQTHYSRTFLPTRYCAIEL